MKKTLIESRLIRSYVLLWSVFVFGLLVAFLFGDTQTQWRNVSIAGVILSFISLMVTIFIFFPVQTEIKVRYPAAMPQEKMFLTGLFYFIRGLLFMTGLLILWGTLSRKDVLAKELTEIGGKIAGIEVYGGDSESLKITFENNTNEYETRTFKIPDRNLEQIQNELKSGDTVFVLIERKDANELDDTFIQIYGVRSAEYNYLTLDEFNRADAANNSFGTMIGIFFTVAGAIYLLTGRIKQQPGQVMRTDENTSGA